MPTYEYACDACANQWEADHKMSDPPVQECPACHAKSAKRLVSGGQGFHLQGERWAKDGYG